MWQFYLVDTLPPLFLPHLSSLAILQLIAHSMILCDTCVLVVPRAGAGTAAHNVVGVPSVLECALTNNTAFTKSVVVGFAAGDAFVLAGVLSQQVAVLPYSTHTVKYVRLAGGVGTISGVLCVNGACVPCVCVPCRVQVARRAPSERVLRRAVGVCDVCGRPIRAAVHSVGAASVRPRRQRQ